MRLIDADALERDGWKMSRTVRVDKDTMEIQTRKPTDFPLLSPAQPEIIFEDIKKYCEKRHLVILTREFYDEMKKQISALNDFDEPKSACSDCQEFDCYGCEHKEELK